MHLIANPATMSRPTPWPYRLLTVGRWDEIKRQWSDWHFGAIVASPGWLKGLLITRLAHSEYYDLNSGQNSSKLRNSVLQCIQSSPVLFGFRGIVLYFMLYKFLPFTDEDLSLYNCWHCLDFTHRSLSVGELTVYSTTTNKPTSLRLSYEWKWRLGILRIVIAFIGWSMHSIRANNIQRQSINWGRRAIASDQLVQVTFP